MFLQNKKSGKPHIEYIHFNPNGLSATRMGFGCWAVGGHGWGPVDDDQSIQAVRYAFEKGVTFYDTADCYGFGKSEEILRKALGRNIRSVVVASKGGVRWNGAGKVWNDSSSDYLRTALERSLKRLGVDHIPLYYLHKHDNKTPLSETMYALAQFRKEGKIGDIGVANMRSNQLSVALSVAPVRAVQVQLNMLKRSFADDLAVLCRRHHIKLVAWGGLADGLLTGKFHTMTKFGEDDHRSRLPDFQGQRFIRNLDRIERVRSFAQNRGISLAQLALRWVMDKYAWACPLFGAKTARQVEENMGAFGWRLTREEISLMDDLVE